MVSTGKNILFYKKQWQDSTDELNKKDHATTLPKIRNGSSSSSSGGPNHEYGRNNSLETEITSRYKRPNKKKIISQGHHSAPSIPLTSRRLFKNFHRRRIRDTTTNSHSSITTSRNNNNLIDLNDVNLDPKFLYQRSSSPLTDYKLLKVTKKNPFYSILSFFKILTSKLNHGRILFVLILGMH